MRNPSSDFSGVCYAHRGLYDNDRGIPENSLPAFRAAAREGYGVELDVQLTSDGQVVVFHDDTLDRICGVHGSVIDRSLAELQQMPLLNTDERIPLFADVLSILKDVAGPLIVELKSGKRNGELCRKTRELLLHYPGKYCVESFDPRIVRWFRLNAPEVFRGQLAQPVADYAGAVSPLAARLLGDCRLCFLTKPDFIAYKIGKRPKRVLRKRKRGVLLIGWTSHNAEEDARTNDAVIFEHCLPPRRCKATDTEQD